MKMKSRDIVNYASQDYVQEYNENWTTDPSPGGIYPGRSSPIKSREVTYSTGHPWFSTRGASTDVGGDFTTVKVKDIVNHTPGSFRTVRNYGARYIGPAWADNPKHGMEYALHLVQPSSDYSLMQLGTKAIANCIPTNPVADAATFIGELKAGLPKLIGKDLLKTKFKDYRKYGSEYINIEFGWKPIVSDLQKFAKAATESDKILKQLERDSGRPIRRKYRFRDVVETHEGEVGGRYCYLPSGIAYNTWLYNGAGTLSISEKITTRTWFSGCFMYHLNMGSSIRDKSDRIAAEARKLAGLELTPAVAWNLAPWSWALDWQGNIGDSLHNMSRFAQDGLVMQYGYIMQSKTAEVTYTLTRGDLNTGLSNTALSHTVIAESKVRRTATPFGFGFDMTALNGRQSAILGALGISRGPRRL